MANYSNSGLCVIDDALKAMGHKDDPQAKVPTSAILTLAIWNVACRLTAALELGGKHNKALPWLGNSGYKLHLLVDDGQLTKAYAM